MECSFARRILGSAAGLQKARKIAAVTQLGDFEADRTGAGLRAAFTVAIAAIDVLAAVLAIGGTAKRFDIHIHQPLQGKLQRF